LAENGLCRLRLGIVYTLRQSRGKNRKSGPLAAQIRVIGKKVIKSVVLPQTYLARDQSGILAGCFDQVFLLRPPDISQAQVDAEEGRPGVFKTLEASPNSEDIGFDPIHLKHLMHQWESWIASHRDSGALETMKAGTKPPQPDLETSRSIKHQIIGGVQPEKRPENQPPASPALVLKLAHLLDQQMGEMRSLATGIDSQHERMSELLGVNQDEEPTAEFQKAAPGLLGSLSLEMEDESLSTYRLQAWACLAPYEEIKNLTPLTFSPQAATLLLERANFILGGKPVRSSAGAQSLVWPPVSLSMAGTSLAREALRLQLPSQEESAGFKAALGKILYALGKAPLSSDLLKSMQEIGGDWLESGGPHKPAGCMSLMVFPGYGMAGLLNLMKGKSTEPENPHASCPLLVIW
jgi:hypothetical protein